MRQYGTLLFIALLSITIAKADIYKRVAADGKIYYTDKPKKISGYKRIIKSRPKSKGYKNSLKYLARNKKKFSPFINNAAKKYNLDAKLLHAVIRTESAYNEKAISSAGAVGLMQLMPATAKRYGVSDRKNGKQNIDGGARYLKDLLKMFNSDLSLVLASYNAGEGAVKKYNNSIPPYPETQNYVRKVLAFYKDPGFS